MRRTFFQLVTLGCLLAAGGIAVAQDTNTPAPLGTDMKSFDLIWQRNIFDASRTGPARIRTAPRVRVIDWFTYTGTISYEKGLFALFDSNRSQYRKAVKASDTIAGYKIAEIMPDGVKLAATSNQTINLPLGAQMRRVDGGRWAFSGHAEAVPEASSDSTPAADGSSAPAAAAEVSGAESDVMKRLMLKRLQEK